MSREVCLLPIRCATSGCNALSRREPLKDGRSRAKGSACSPPSVHPCSNAYFTWVALVSSPRREAIPCKQATRSPLKKKSEYDEDA